MRTCTCLGSCRGAAWLAPGWRCALGRVGVLIRYKGTRIAAWTPYGVESDSELAEQCRARLLAAALRDVKLPEVEPRFGGVFVVVETDYP